MNVDTAPAVAEKHLGSLAKRILSALVLAPIAIGAIWWGAPFYNALVIAGGILLSLEWSRLCGEGRFSRSRYVLQAVVIAGNLAVSFHLAQIGVALILVGALAVYGAALAERAPNPLWLAAGAIYLGIPSAALLWLRDHGGAFAVLWLFAAVWATDIGAYAVGRLIGGPRLAPRLSPNKTWAGLIGGIAAAAAVGYAFSPALEKGGAGYLVCASAVLALVAQAGDLLESAIKRRFKVKDTGALIPGHGGLFDRVDSLLAAAPAVVLVQLVSGGSAFAWR